jgi:MFS family permease
LRAFGVNTLCGFAPDIACVIAARALQAVGAAMLSANSVAIIVSIAGDKLRGRALGIQTAVRAVGLCAGPTVGGWIVDALDWRWVFWVNVPFGVIGTVIAWFIIPQTSAAKSASRFGMPAALLLVSGLGALMFAINQVGSWGLTSPRVVASAVAGALLLTVSLLANIILFGLFFLTPFTFERVFGETAFSGGLRLTTIPLALGLMAPISGALSDRIGNRILCTGGMLVVFAGLVLLSLQLSAGTPSLAVVTLSLVVSASVEACSLPQITMRSWEALRHRRPVRPGAS